MEDFNEVFDDVWMVKDADGLRMAVRPPDMTDADWASINQPNRRRSVGRGVMWSAIPLGFVLMVLNVAPKTLAGALVATVFVGLAWSWTAPRQPKFTEIDEKSVLALASSVVGPKLGFQVAACVTNKMNNLNDQVAALLRDERTADPACRMLLLAHTTDNPLSTEATRKKVVEMNEELVAAKLREQSELIDQMIENRREQRAVLTDTVGA